MDVAKPIAATDRTVRFGPTDREPLPYALVPFEVGPGAHAIRISLDYADAAASADGADGNIVDLGLLGPGPTDVGRAAFRGWSGSERLIVVVGEHAATPGYRPGPIRPGTWHVLLGLYQILPSGCTATVRFEAYSVMPPLPDQPPAAQPVPALTGQIVAEPMPNIAKSERWIPADLHAHTIHSDGVEDVGSLARRAHASGLEALFVTDHNTDAHLLDLGQTEPPALLAGEEVTTYRGHLNAIGIEQWVEFRYATPAGVAIAIQEIHAQDALASVNHPTSSGIPWLHGTDLDFDCVEVWNGPWSAEDDQAVAWWESILATGRHTVAVGGSDTHGPGPNEQAVGTPTTWLRACGLERDSLVSAIRAGRVVLTRDPHLPPPTLTAEHAGRRASIGDTMIVGMSGDSVLVRWTLDGLNPTASATVPDGLGAHPRRRVRLVGDGHVQHEAPAFAEGAWRVARGDQISRIRLEVRETNGDLVCLTNPIFFEETAT